MNSGGTGCRWRTITGAAPPSGRAAGPITSGAGGRRRLPCARDRRGTQPRVGGGAARSLRIPDRWEFPEDEFDVDPRRRDRTPVTPDAGPEPIPDLGHDLGFRDFLRGGGSAEAVPVLALDETVQRELGTRATKALLTRETAHKQRKHALSPADYARLGEIAREGTMLRSKVRHLDFVLEGEKSWHAVLKTTRDGREVYLQSLRHTNERDIRRLRRRGVEISREEK